MRRFVWIGVLWVLYAQGVWAGEGYSIIGDRVVVSRRDHWEKWTYPIGALDIQWGVVQPLYIREPEDPFDPAQKVNAVENIQDFEYLLENVLRRDPDYLKRWPRWPVRAGSNEAAAANVIDGNPDTFWEPDPKDLLPPSFRQRFYSWWLEIDLGRVVNAVRVVVRFVDEGKGDPFRQFKVYVSDGTPISLMKKEALSYTYIGGTTKPNEGPDARREFSFDLTTTAQWQKATRGRESRTVYAATTISGRKADVYWVGDVVRYIRIEVTDWKGGTHPRLADVEVWTRGDNIAIGTVRRGGYLREPLVVENWESPTVNASAGGDAADGDIVNHWIAYVWSPYRGRGRLVVDLGATFWVDTYQLIACRETVLNAPTLDGYIVEASDGSRAPNGRLIWRQLSPETRKYEDRNIARISLFEDRFSLQKIRYFNIRNYDVTGARAGAYEARGSLAELIVMGRGYVPEVELVSPLIELGGERNISTVEWDADVPEGTKLEVQTRTGNELREIRRYYDKGGSEISETRWRRLPGFMKGPVDTEYVPGADWSGWSMPYKYSGAAITSPSPRKYMMIRVRMLSNDPERRIKLRSLKVRFIQPIASRILGEIYPAGPRGLQAGREEKFSFYLRPWFSAPSVEDPKGSLGFDEVRIQAPPSVNIQLEEVVLYADSARTALEYGHILAAEELAKLGDREPERFGVEDLEVVDTGPDTLWIRLPRVVKVDQFRMPLIYHRVVREVEVDSLKYTKLKGDEKGSVRYMERRGLEEVQVSREYYLAHGGAGNPNLLVRYYKVDAGAEPEEIPFDKDGRALPRAKYYRLPSGERGHIYVLGDLLEVKFKAAIYMAGSLFKAALARSDIPGSWQRVDPGDATGLVETQTTTVSVLVGEERVVEDFRMVPEVFTPNGDGVNDTVSVQFTVLKVNRPRRIRVYMYDLDGMLVRDLSGKIAQKESASGQYEVGWDGRDDEGRLVLPGVYVCRVVVPTDAGEQSEMRTVSVVF
ncbi:MAG TPA: hypothetical protein EYP17_00825 [Candidatus Latescibacteria bacterium]|nr:hypothetical protein [Candidatus Latescibacterota bacterium]